MRHRGHTGSSGWLSLCLFVCLSVCLFVGLFLFVCLFVSVGLFVCFCLFVCLFGLVVCLVVRRSVGPFGRLFSGRVVRSFRADDVGFVGRSVPVSSCSTLSTVSTLSTK